MTLDALDAARSCGASTRARPGRLNALRELAFAHGDEPQPAAEP
jgi:hypothetical protein